MDKIPDELKVMILEPLEPLELSNVYEALVDWRGCVLYVINKKFKSYKFKSYDDRELIKSLHDDVIYMLIEMDNPNKSKSHLSQLLAYCGKLDLLKLAHEKGWLLNKKTSKAAVCGGNLDIMKYLREIGCPDSRSIDYYAAANGHLHILKDLYKNGHTFSDLMYDFIYPSWDTEFSEYAAVFYGVIPCLEELYYKRLECREYLKSLNYDRPCQD